MLEGSGRWQKKPQRFAFDEGMGPDPVIERMRDAWRGGSLIKDGGDALYKTRAGIGEGEVNGRIDVAKAETLLEQAGAMDLTDLEGPTGFWADDKEAGILKFQTANGLKTDGKMLPHGETMRTLESKLAPKSAIKPVKVADALAATGTKSDASRNLISESAEEKVARRDAPKAPTSKNDKKDDAPKFRPRHPVRPDGTEIPPHPKDPRFNPDGSVREGWLTGEKDVDPFLKWGMENTGYDDEGNFVRYDKTPGYHRDPKTGGWVKGEDKDTQKPRFGESKT